MTYSMTQYQSGFDVLCHLWTNMLRKGTLFRRNGLSLNNSNRCCTVLYPFTKFVKGLKLVIQIHMFAYFCLFD